MAGEVINIKVCSPLKLRSGLKGITTQSATTHTIYRCHTYIERYSVEKNDLIFSENST